MAKENSLFVSMPFQEFQDLLKNLIQDELKDLNNKLKTPEDDLMSIDDVKTFLQVSKVTIHAWKKKKLIRSYRIGRRIFFKKHELVDCLKTSENKNLKSKATNTS